MSCSVPWVRAMGRVSAVWGGWVCAWWGGGLHFSISALVGAAIIHCMQHLLFTFLIPTKLKRDCDGCCSYSLHCVYSDMCFSQIPTFKAPVQVGFVLVPPPFLEPPSCWVLSIPELKVPVSLHLHRQLLEKMKIPLSFNCKPCTMVVLVL